MLSVTSVVKSKLTKGLFNHCHLLLVKPSFFSSVLVLFLPPVKKCYKNQTTPSWMKIVRELKQAHTRILQYFAFKHFC